MPDTPVTTQSLAAQFAPRAIPNTVATLPPVEWEFIEASRARHIARRQSDAAYDRFQAALAAFRAEVDREEGLA